MIVSAVVGLIIGVALAGTGFLLMVRLLEGYVSRGVWDYLGYVMCSGAVAGLLMGLLW